MQTLPGATLVPDVFYMNPNGATGDPFQFVYGFVHFCNCLPSPRAWAHLRDPWGSEYEPDGLNMNPSHGDPFRVPNHDFTAICELSWLLSGGPLAAELDLGGQSLTNHTSEPKQNMFLYGMVFWGQVVVTQCYKSQSKMFPGNRRRSAGSSKGPLPTP